MSLGPHLAIITIMTIKQLRILWLSLLAILVCWLLWQALSPLGKTTYSTTFSKDNYFIGKVSPAERVEKNAQGMRISGEPVYFSLFTPRRFERAILTIDFSSPPKLVEAGLRRDKTTWNFDLKPMYSVLLEQLQNDSNTIHEGDTLLWQKNKTFSSISDFLKKAASISSVMSYRYALPHMYKSSEAGTNEALRRYDIGLRGAYQFYTYSSGKPIALRLAIKDRNEIAKETATEINIYRGTELIFSKTAPDINTAGETTIECETKNLEPGVYRVEVKASDDIISNSLSTNQKKISFIGRLWITDPASLPLQLYTDSETVTAQTNNPASRQRLIVAGKTMDINESYRQFVLDTGDTTRSNKEVLVSKKDIIIAGDGLWSFTKESLFNPSLRTVTATSVKEKLGTDYLIAQYHSPQQLENGEYRSVLEFDLRGAYREDSKYSFMISAPTAQLTDANFTIRRISVELRDPNFYGALKQLWQ